MDKERVKAFSDKIFADMAGAMTVGLGFVGVKTGLFRAMAGKGPMTLKQVVAATSLQSRYVDEWLKGMVCAGYLDHDPGADTYRLPEEHAFLLASEGSRPLWSAIGSGVGGRPALFESVRQSDNLICDE